MEFKVGDRVKHKYLKNEIGVVVAVRDYNTASLGCTPTGLTVLVRLDGYKFGSNPVSCFQPNHLERIEEADNA